MPRKLPIAKRSKAEQIKWMLRAARLEGERERKLEEAIQAICVWEEEITGPTMRNPATIEKLAVMRKRAERKLNLFHKDDYNHTYYSSTPMNANSPTNL